MPAKGANSRCLYKGGETKIVIIDSEEELIAKEDGWADSPGGSPSISTTVDPEVKEESSTDKQADQEETKIEVE